MFVLQHYNAFWADHYVSSVQAKDINLEFSYSNTILSKFSSKKFGIVMFGSGLAVVALRTAEKMSALLQLPMSSAGNDGISLFEICFADSFRCQICFQNWG